MYNEFSQIQATSLADAEQLLLSARWVFPRYETQPRCQLAASVELLAFAYKGNKRCRIERDNAWKGLQRAYSELRKLKQFQ